MGNSPSKSPSTSRSSEKIDPKTYDMNDILDRVEQLKEGHEYKGIEEYLKNGGTEKDKSFFENTIKKKIAKGLDKNSKARLAYDNHTSRKQYMDEANDILDDAEKDIKHFYDGIQKHKSNHSSKSRGGSRRKMHSKKNTRRKR